MGRQKDSSIVVVSGYTAAELLGEEPRHSMRDQVTFVVSVFLDPPTMAVENLVMNYCRVLVVVG